MQRNGSVYGSKPGAISIDDLARKIASSPTSEDLLEMETYGEAEVPILFLLDHSGSTRAPFSGAMSRWQVIVRDVMATIRAIRRNEIQSMSSCITVAVFNGDFKVLCAHVPAYELNADQLEAELLACRPTGVTAMGKAILSTLDLLRARKEALKAQKRRYGQGCLILFTDGQPTNEAGEVDESTMEEAYAAVDALFEARKLTILPVGIMGEDSTPEDFSVLKRLLLCNPVLPGDKGPIPVFTDVDGIDRYFRFIDATIVKIMNGEDCRLAAREFLGYKI